MAEQRYQAVMTVIGDGLAVTQAPEKVGGSRQTMHACSPTTTGKIERFHRTLRDEFLSEHRLFRTIAQAQQQALDSRRPTGIRQPGPSSVRE